MSENNRLTLFWNTVDYLWIREFQNPDIIDFPEQCQVTLRDIMGNAVATAVLSREVFNSLKNTLHGEIFELTYPSGMAVNVQVIHA